MDRFQLRRDSLENWELINPVLLEGEIGLVLDTKSFKIGDGIHTWSQLDYSSDPTILQELGDSESAIMSLKAVTNNILENRKYLPNYKIINPDFSGYIGLDGAPHSSSIHKVKYLEVKKGLVIYFIGHSDTDIMAIAFSKTLNSTWVLCAKGLNISEPIGYSYGVVEDGYIAISYRLAYDAYVLVSPYNESEYITYKNLQINYYPILKCGTYVSGKNWGLTQRSTRCSFIVYPNNLFSVNREYWFFKIHNLPSNFKFMYGIGYKGGTAKVTLTASISSVDPNYFMIKIVPEELDKLVITFAKLDDSDITENDITSFYLEKCNNLITEVSNIGLESIPDFVANSKYQIGDIVKYRDEKIYQFLVDYSGNWDVTKVKLLTILSMISLFKGVDILNDTMFDVNNFELDPDQNLNLKLEYGIKSIPPSLNNICYEGMSYKDIFQNNSLFSWNFEEDRSDISSYLGEKLEITDIVADTGYKSLLCETNGSTRLLVHSNLQPFSPKGVYIAFRGRIDNYTSGSMGVIIQSTRTAMCSNETDGFLTFSNLCLTGPSISNIYFGVYSTLSGGALPVLSGFMDTLVVIDLSIFSIIPTKELLDLFYNNYISILKNNNIDSRIISIPNLSKSPYITGEYPYNTYTSVNAFVLRMTAKALLIGMLDSTFYNPYGGSRYGYNRTTAKDLLKLTMYAIDNEKFRDFWSTKSVTCEIYGANHRLISVTNEIYNQFNIYYLLLHPGLLNPYILLANKAGGWGAGDISNRSFCIIAVAVVLKLLVAAVVTNTTSTSTTGRIDRVKALILLLDICNAKLSGEDISGMNITYADKAVAAVIPLYSNSYKDYDFELLYSLDPITLFNPASTTKVLAGLTALDIIQDLCITHLINYTELINDSSYIALIGDIETIETSLYIAMLASNAANTLSLARYCGMKILLEKNKLL